MICFGLKNSLTIFSRILVVGLDQDHICPHNESCRLENLQEPKISASLFNIDSLSQIDLNGNESDDICIKLIWIWEGSIAYLGGHRNCCWDSWNLDCIVSPTKMLDAWNSEVDVEYMFLWMVLNPHEQVCVLYWMVWNPHEEAFYKSFIIHFWIKYCKLIYIINIVIWL